MTAVTIRWYTVTRCHTLQHAATHCNTLRHNATRSDTMQHISTRCHTPQRTATHCNILQPQHPRARLLSQFTGMLQNAATLCNALQHVATRCDTLQHTTTHCNTPQHTATHCNTLQQQHPRARLPSHCASMLQHTATHCDRMQRTATHCNVMKCTAIQCNNKNTLALNSCRVSVFSYACCCCCEMVQTVAAFVCCSVLQCVAVSCSLLHVITACCSVLQFVAVYGMRGCLLRISSFFCKKPCAETGMIIILIEELLLTMFSTTHCNTLQHTAKYCKSLQQQKSPTQLGLSTAGQHTATHCNTQQHTHTHTHKPVTRQLCAALLRWGGGGGVHDYTQVAAFINRGVHMLAFNGNELGIAIHSEEGGGGSPSNQWGVSYAQFEVIAQWKSEMG